MTSYHFRSKKKKALLISAAHLTLKYEPGLNDTLITVMTHELQEETTLIFSLKSA